MPKSQFANHSFNPLIKPNLNANTRSFLITCFIFLHENYLFFIYFFTPPVLHLFTVHLCSLFILLTWLLFCELNEYSVFTCKPLKIKLQFSHGILWHSMSTMIILNAFIMEKHNNLFLLLNQLDKMVKSIYMIGRSDHHQHNSSAASVQPVHIICSAHIKKIVINLPVLKKKHKAYLNNR